MPSRSCLDEIHLAAQPAFDMRLCGGGILPQKRVGRVAGLLDQRRIALQIREAQQRNTGLLCAEEFTRAANDEILARDLEAVAVLVDDLEARFRGIGKRLLEQKVACAL